jgi:hypothetical protein
VQAVSQGPVLVYMDAQTDAFRNYAGGIFNNDICSQLFTNQ